MRILFFYTAHRQTSMEMMWQREFFNRELKSLCDTHDVDILCHYNSKLEPSEQVNINNILQQFCARNKWFIQTNKNSGYTTGHIEAWNDFSGLASNYDLVIALHPDVYITDGHKLVELINKHDPKNADCIDCYVYQLSGKEQFTTDFWIYRPQISHIFKEISHTTIFAPEMWLYDAIFDLQNDLDNFFTFCKIDRSGTENPDRIVDAFGLLHTHNILQAQRVFEEL